MKKGIKSRLLALLCAFVLCFCDVGVVLAENNVTLPVAEENQDGVVLPDDNFTETPDNGTTETPDNGTTETPDNGTTDEPDQPEHTHVYVETITKEPTYTEKGVKTFTCECGDSYTEEIDMLTLKTPSFDKVECAVDGIVLSWGEVEGATCYKIFRGKETDKYEEYTELVTVNAPETSYIDKEVESGTIYCYYVIAYNEVNKSMHTSETIIMYLAQPEISCGIDDADINIYVGSVKGANYYSLERLDSNMLWEEINRVKATEGLLTLVDSNILSGEIYTYRIKAIFADEERLFESVYSEEVSISWEGIGVPESFKVGNNGYTQLKLTWESVMGAEGYQIYRSKTNKTGSFVKVATVTGEKYIDKNLTTDTKYYYKIRSYAGDEVSDFTEVKSATPKVLTPKMKKTANATGTSIKVSWTKPAGAHGYYVYRKQGADGPWKRIATVKDPDTTSYKDTTATGRYYYAVRAYKKVSGKTYTSLRANSVQASVLKKATVSSVKQKGSERAVTVTWNKVSNATGYQVYKKIGKNGSWKLAKTTGKDARSFSSEIPQGTYTYWKVRAIRKINDVTTYALFSDSKSFIFATPKFNYELGTNYGKSVKTVKLTIENTSKASLRFYTEEAMLINAESQEFDRYLYIVDSDGDKLNYSDVKAGKEKTITFKVDGNSTAYYGDSIFSVVFRYDGLKYLFLTYADGSYYELYLLE